MSADYGDRGDNADHPDRLVDPAIGSDRAALSVSRRATFRFVAAALIALALAVVTYVALVTTEPGQRVEDLALRGAELRTSTEREAALGRLSVVTVAGVALAVVGVLTAGFLRHREPLALLAATAMVGAIVIVEILKEVLPRPTLVDGPPWLLRNSFPSGSAAVATSIAIGALLVAPDRLRWAALVAGALFAAIVGEAVQTTGWHRLSDTIGGVCLVIAVSASGLALLSVGGSVELSDAARIDRRLLTGLYAVAFGTVALGVALAVLPVVFPLLGTPVGARRSILQTAFPLIGVGVTILALATFARVIEPYSLGRRRSGATPTD